MPGYLPAQGEPPKHLHYDLWLGPSPWHPYNPDYFGGCLKWNIYWDFGSGQIGDMGRHTMDLAWNGMDTTLPTIAEATGNPLNPDVTFIRMESHFDMPANPSRRPAGELSPEACLKCTMKSSAIISERHRGQPLKYK